MQAEAASGLGREINVEAAEKAQYCGGTALIGLRL
jgi:hypothetical protein